MRTFVRREVQIREAVLDCDSLPCHQVTVRNFSANGAQVWSTLKCTPGANAKLIFDAQPGKRTVKGVVRYSRPVPGEGGNVYATGIEFFDASPLLKWM